MATDPVPELGPTELTSGAAPSPSLRPEERETLILYPEGAGDDHWAPGDCIEGQYEVREVRGGRGKTGMGIVCIVDGPNGRRFAMKTFQRRFALRLDFIRRFIREARTWMLTGFHPNIAHAYHVDIVRAMPLLFIEFVPSDKWGRHTLGHYLKDGPLGLGDALSYALQCCRGMAHAAAAVPGLVHRDLKPDNLLIDPWGHLKITDFGLARCGGELAISLDAFNDPSIAGHITQVGSFFGTPAYMAPEQFSDPAEVTGAADIYAFACCLFEMIAGQPPFEAKTGTTGERIAELQRLHREAEPPRLRDCAPSCPPALESLVMSCLAKDPAARPGTFDAVAGELTGILHALDLPVPLMNSADPLPREVARQMRSLSLLDGYERAVRLHKLRESQELCPYGFHLALSSYFHAAHDHVEELRQLEKTLLARNGETGDEAVRRLTEHLIAEDRLEEAAAHLDTFLMQHPEASPQVFEPRVRLAIARGDYNIAAQMLDTAQPGLRVNLLRVELLEAQGDKPALAALCAAMANTELDRLTHAVASLKPGDCIGIHAGGDATLLADILAALRPTCDTAVLRGVSCAAWPDLTGTPDFAGGMAWLSFALGKLAALDIGLGNIEAGAVAVCAQRLRFPERLHEYLERDEAWFWRQDPGE